MKHIFIRNDDVFELDDRFKAFHRLLQELDLPVVYAIIPEKLTDDCAAFLKQEKDAHPEKIDLVQHGWAHTKHSVSPKYEFGPARIFQHQYDDILHGKQLLEKKLGKERITSVFVPPYNAFNYDTIDILEELGFLGISAGAHHDLRRSILQQFPSQLDVSAFPSGGSYYNYSLKELLRSFLSLKSAFIGMVSHHRTLDDTALADLRKFLKLLSAKKDISFVHFSTFIAPQQKQRRISDVTIEITNRCNLRCTICTIWAEKEQHDLSFSSLKELFNSSMLADMFSVSFTGGECFLHPEFKALLKYVISLKLKKRIYRIDIVSNGYDTERITHLFAHNPSFIPHMHLHISLDGIGGVHDAQRGVPGAFEQTRKTMQQLQRLSVPLTIKFTITPQNYHALPEVYSFCRQHLLPLELKLVEASNAFYYNRLKSPKTHLVFSEDCKKEIVNQINQLLVQDQTYQLLDKDLLLIILDALQGKKMMNICRTPKYSLFITSSGGVHPCLYYPPIANIHDTNWDSAIFDTTHQKIIQDGKKQTCPGCFAYHGYLRDWNLRKTR